MRDAAKQEATKNDTSNCNYTQICQPNQAGRQASKPQTFEHLANEIYDCFDLFECAFFGCLARKPKQEESKAFRFMHVASSEARQQWNTFLLMY